MTKFTLQKLGMPLAGSTEAASVLARVKGADDAVAFQKAFKEGGWIGKKFSRLTLTGDRIEYSRRKDMFGFIGHRMLLAGTKPKVTYHSISEADANVKHLLGVQELPELANDSQALLRKLGG